MEFLKPNWKLANNVHALSTLRSGGVSVAPYASFNLGAHVGDNPSAVAANRTLLLEKAQLPQLPLYLNQTHSTTVLRLPTTATALEADAVYTDQTGQVCLVMTADCLPVLFATEDGNEVAAAHAGWRGLCDGILENTVAQFHAKPSQIVVWLAPAISQSAFRVGGEVRSAFIQHDPQAALAFEADLTMPDKYFADLYLLARQRLKKCGIHLIYGGECCTFSQKERFFSYRRDGVTGRMASLIWFEENN